MRSFRLILLAALTALAACRGDAGHSARPRNLDELVIKDSMYYAPETMQPYSGPVFSNFTLHPDQVQLEGTLQDGTWDGELRIFHRNGRIRYEGRFEHGERCGAWTENTDPRPTVNILQELDDAIQSLAMYPPCSDDR